MSFPLLTREANQLRIDCRNGCTVVVECVDGRVGGIRHVDLDGTPLRSSDECIWPQIATPEGLEVDHYELLNVRVEGGAVVIDTRPWWRTGHRMEWQEHGGHQRISTASWSKGARPGHDHRLTWVIRPAAKLLGNRDYRGFSYSFSWRAPGAAIYQVEDKATWEIGGRATGNTWIMRSSFAPSVQTLDRTTNFDSGWTMPGIANPYIFQHLPLYTCMSGFTFQCNESLSLVTVHDRPSHVRSLFHQDCEQDLLLHFNQFVFDLTEEIDLPARAILAAPADTDSAELPNHYLAVRDQIQATIRAHYGACHHRARPAGTLECWDIAELDRFPASLQWMHEQGMRQIFVMPLWRSNETDLKPALTTTSGDGTQWGELGNMCCVLEAEIAERYGGWEALQEALEPASHLGLECYTWYSYCFSSLSPLGARIPDLYVHDQSGQISRNNYGHRLFTVNNRSEGHLELFKTAMRRLNKAGIRGIMRDSHCNMGTDSIDYRVGGDVGAGSVSPDQAGDLRPGRTQVSSMIYSMHDSETEQMRFCQQELRWLYVVESSGVLGLPRCSTALSDVHYNEWLYDDMSSYTSADAIRRCGRDPVDVYFRGMANRLFYTVAVNPNQWPADGSISDWCDPAVIGALNRAFLAIESDLEHRRVLPQNKGIVWTSRDGTEVIFAYSDFSYPVDKVAVIEDVLSQTRDRCDGVVACKRHRIYRLRAPGHSRTLDRRLVASHA